MNILQISLITLLVFQLLLICYSDIRHRIISNKLVITVAINSLVLSFIIYHRVGLTIPLLALFIGYITFHFKLIGGGDVKLITALLFSLNAEQSLNFILYTAIMGGVVMIIGMLINRTDIQQRGVPYAVAISSGFLVSLLS
ncbi:putative tight adherance operon protein [Yersinia thracica]|uniref:Putative tight adherance operon protein n=1 Tax=Yersinia thracica TaxID=2890319 RepID=A0A0T9NEB3_9GAMM|nr:prepilin peptidase [Yersinia thracica]CNH02869.1 putative tight adherance operon protein [Yersinia thracica]